MRPSFLRERRGIKYYKLPPLSSSVRQSTVIGIKHFSTNSSILYNISSFSIGRRAAVRRSEEG